MYAVGHVLFPIGQEKILRRQALKLAALDRSHDLTATQSRQRHQPRRTSSWMSCWRNMDIGQRLSGNAGGQETLET